MTTKIDTRILPLLAESPEVTGEPCPYCGSHEYQGVDEHGLLSQTFRMGPSTEFALDYDAYRDEIGTYHYVECAKCEKVLWLNTTDAQGYYSDDLISRICNAIAKMDDIPLKEHNRIVSLLKAHATTRLNP